jgi:hypothetical protein
MNVSEVIEQVSSEQGLSRYAMAKALNVPESRLSRAYNQKSDPGFNEVNAWLEKLGYREEIVSCKPAYDHEPMDINHFGRILAKTDDEDYDYLALYNSFKQLLEAPTDIEVTFYPGRILHPQWRAFYAAMIAYLYKLYDKRLPAFAAVNRNGLSDAWCPIKDLGRSHTDFDETFLEYGVLLPEGELRWI